jgi:hypothetical protein
MKTLFVKGMLGPSLGILLASTVFGAEEQSYVLAGSTLPATGVTMTRTSTQELQDGTVTFNNGGKIVTGATTRKITCVEVIKVLAPDKFSRELTDSASSGNMVVGTESQPLSAAPNPFLHVVAVATQGKDGRWRPALENGDPLTPEQLALMGNNINSSPFDSDLAVLGTEPRKAGEKWQIDASKVPSFEGLENLAGRIDCEFTEVREVAAAPAAVIHFALDITGNPPGSEARVHLSGELTQARSIEDRIELESHAREKVEITAPAAEGTETKVSGLSVKTMTTVVKRP